MTDRESLLDIRAANIIIYWFGVYDVAPQLGTASPMKPVGRTGPTVGLSGSGWIDRWIVRPWMTVQGPITARLLMSEVNITVLHGYSSYLPPLPTIITVLYTVVHRQEDQAV